MYVCRYIYGERAHESTRLTFQQTAAILGCTAEATANIGAVAAVAVVVVVVTSETWESVQHCRSLVTLLQHYATAAALPTVTG